MALGSALKAKNWQGNVWQRNSLDRISGLLEPLQVFDFPRVARSSQTLNNSIPLGLLNWLPQAQSRFQSIETARNVLDGLCLDRLLPTASQNTLMTSF